MNLEDLQPEATVRGIVNAEWHGSDALTLVYRCPDGRVANEILYPHDEVRLEVVEAGRPWSFEGDDAQFRLARPVHFSPASSFRPPGNAPHRMSKRLASEVYSGKGA